MFFILSTGPVCRKIGISVIKSVNRLSLFERQILNDNNKNNKPDLTLKPAGSYLGSLSDFASLLGTIDEADKAAKELLSETDRKSVV